MKQSKTSTLGDKINENKIIKTFFLPFNAHEHKGLYPAVWFWRKKMLLIIHGNQFKQLCLYMIYASFN